MSSKLSRAAAVACAILCLTLVACSTSAELSRTASVKPENDRKPAPNFALKDADGKTVQLSDYRGKVVLLNFWATWCGPCKMEIPWFVEFERKYKDQGFAVIGVSMDDDGWEVVKPFVQDTGLNYRIVLGDDSVGQLYGGIESLPTTFMIDREGKIATVHFGLVSKSRYENDLRHLFASAASSSIHRRSGVPAFFTWAE